MLLAFIMLQVLFPRFFSSTILSTVYIEIHEDFNLIWKIHFGAHQTQERTIATSNRSEHYHSSFWCQKEEWILLRLTRTMLYAKCRNVTDQIAYASANTKSYAQIQILSFTPLCMCFRLSIKTSHKRLNPGTFIPYNSK